MAELRKCTSHCQAGRLSQSATNGRGVDDGLSVLTNISVKGAHGPWNSVDFSLNKNRISLYKPYVNDCGYFQCRSRQGRCFCMGYDWSCILVEQNIPLGMVEPEASDMGKHIGVGIKQ